MRARLESAADAIASVCVLPNAAATPIDTTSVMHAIIGIFA
jgi:hypothetical protein